MTSFNGSPSDPLVGQVAHRQKELFMAFSKVASGFSQEDVAGAAMNLLANAIRQACPTQAGAEQAFDQMAYKTKTLLLEQHYYNGGRRKNVFPHTQTLEVGPPGWNKNKF